MILFFIRLGRDLNMLKAYCCRHNKNYSFLHQNLFIFLLKFSIFSFYFPDVFTLVNLPLRILYGDFSTVS